MSYQSGPSRHRQVLEKITSEFSRFREEGRGHYSEEHKSMVISAIGMGLRRSHVAAAAGISKGSIRCWLERTPKAKELKLVSAPVARGGTALAADLIRIRMVSGVEMDFPRSELSIDFLEMLNCIGCGR